MHQTGFRVRVTTEHSFVLSALERDTSQDSGLLDFLKIENFWLVYHCAILCTSFYKLSAQAYIAVSP